MENSSEEPKADDCACPTCLLGSALACIAVQEEYSIMEVIVALTEYLGTMLTDIDPEDREHVLQVIYMRFRAHLSGNAAAPGDEFEAGFEGGDTPTLDLSLPKPGEKIN